MRDNADSRAAPILLKSGTELARMIREGETTSREVVEAHIAQIQKVNPRINAVVKDRFKEARAEADAADTKIKEADKRLEEIGPLPPFHGVPCTIKECFSLTGMPQTGGLIARKGFLSREDAPAVARLRQAGAIPLGVTNLSELCMWMESNNRVYGRTNNPYDTRRIVGGSSGGEGAIIGAGGVPFGLGSDIGGSIRLPAFFNGVFGHKPTGGLVPVSGQFPIIGEGGQRYLTTGPLARRAEDLMPLLKILAGATRPEDHLAGRPLAADQVGKIPLGDPAQIDLSGVTVLNVESDGLHRVSRDLREAQQGAVDAMARRGVRTTTIKIEGFRKSLQIWSAMLSEADPTPFGTLLGNGTPIKIFREMARWVFRRSAHTLPAIALAGLDRIVRKLPRTTGRFVDYGLKLRQELVEMIGPNGVLFYPPYPEPAPRHYRPMFGRFKWVYTGIFNVMEFPVTAVPLGLNKKGLPLGVQVAAIHGNDPLTIRIALELENALGGWVPPICLPGQQYL